jgi:hypothetical protein
LGVLFALLVPETVLGEIDEYPRPKDKEKDIEYLSQSRGIGRAEFGDIPDRADDEKNTGIKPLPAFASTLSPPKSGAVGEQCRYCND